MIIYVIRRKERIKENQAMLNALLQCPMEQLVSRTTVMCGVHGYTYTVDSRYSGSLKYGHLDIPAINFG